MNPLFQIFSLSAEEANKIAAAPDSPHNHDFEELIIGIEGELEHFIDFRSETLQAPFVCFVTKGKIHRLKPALVNGKFKVLVIRFISEFIPETSFQLYAHFHDHANLQMAQGYEFDSMVTLANMMQQEWQRENPDYIILKHLLNALFAMVEAERKRQKPVDASVHATQNLTFKNFLILLEENFHRQESVSFYADKLFMSARNLNLICQNILQKSVLEIIESRKLLEAKNLLVNSDKTISEIGFELGYQEKTYFTNVFRKKTGQTPSEFREEMKRMIT